MEFDFGGVAEGIKDAEKEIGGDVFGVAVHDGGNASAGSTRQARNLRVGQALALNNLNNLGVEIAAKLDFRSVSGSKAEGLGQFGGGAGDDGLRLLHGATPLAASFPNPDPASALSASFS